MSRIFHDLSSEWELEKLASVTHEIKSGFASGKRDENGIVQLRMNNVDVGGKINLDKTLKVPIPKNIADYYLQNGDVLFNNTNSVDLVGKTSIFDSEITPCTFSNHLTRIRGDSTKVVQNWILYNLISLWKQGIFYRICNRHVGQAGITSKDIHNLRIPIPPLVEQRGIVEVLGTVDECIRLTDAVIERAEELKRGLMQQLLTRGIGHTEYKETLLGEIPKTWKIRKIRNICKLRKNKKDLPNEIAHIPMEKIPEKDIFAEYEMVKKEKIKSGIYCEQGDILIAKITPSFENGKQAIVPVIPSICAIATTEIIPLIVKENINPYFIFYYLKQKHIRDIITSKMEGSTGRQRVPTDILLNHVMAVPPVDEQNKISQIFLTIEEKIKSESYKKNHLLEIKQGLMQLLLSGKIRVELKGDELHRIGDSREANN